MPEVRKTVAYTLLGDLPELGGLTRKQIAALTGVPHSIETMVACEANGASARAGPERVPRST
jgi:hypothetical protein